MRIRLCPKLIAGKQDKYLNIFSDFDFDKYENFDDYMMKNNYIGKTLDIFEHQLQINDTQLLIIDNSFLRLKQEEKYLSFVDRLFYENNKSAKVGHIGIDLSDIQICKIKLEEMDSIDKYILLNQIKTFDNNANIYHIDDILLIRFFLKAMLREAISSTLYFENLDIVITDGFDLSLPIYIKSKESYKKYKDIAQKYDLCLR